MARIRSVFPGLFTDEAFIMLGSDAQIFLIGLWTEADDQGVFEWKPMTLRVRLRPGRDGDVVPILEELAAGDCIKKYEVDGRHYGAIRNFRKYQKPKSPNAVHPITDEIRTYVRLPIVISEIDEADDESIPPKGENAVLMEEGGGRREDGEERKAARSTSERLPKPVKPRKAPAIALPSDWIPSKEGIEYAKKMRLSEAEIARERERFRNNAQQNDRKCSSWDAAWRNWCLKAAEFLNKPPPSSSPPNGNGHGPPAPVRPENYTRERWVSVMQTYKLTGFWKQFNGPSPLDAGCLVPKDLLQGRLL
jgi:hypothetical protein